MTVILMGQVESVGLLAGLCRLLQADDTDLAWAYESLGCAGFYELMLWTWPGCMGSQGLPVWASAHPSTQEGSGLAMKFLNNKRVLPWSLTSLMQPGQGWQQRGRP